MASHYDFCTILQPDCRGTDHGNRDWSPADGDVVSGVHCNVRTFAIEANITVKVEPWTNNSANFGTLKVYAYDIIIRGTLTAKGAGYKGGEQSTKSNSSGKQGESFQSKEVVIHLKLMFRLQGFVYIRYVHTVCI